MVLHEIEGVREEGRAVVVETAIAIQTALSANERQRKQCKQRRGKRSEMQRRKRRFNSLVAHEHVGDRAKNTAMRHRSILQSKRTVENDTPWQLRAFYACGEEHASAGCESIIPALRVHRGTFTVLSPRRPR